MRLAGFGCLDRAADSHIVGAMRNRQPAKRSFPSLNLARNDRAKLRNPEYPAQRITPTPNRSKQKDRQTFPHSLVGTRKLAPMTWKVRSLLHTEDRPLTNGVCPEINCINSKYERNYLIEIPRSSVSRFANRLQNPRSPECCWNFREGLDSSIRLILRSKLAVLSG